MSHKKSQRAIEKLKHLNAQRLNSHKGFEGDSTVSFEPPAKPASFWKIPADVSVMLAMILPTIKI